MLPRGRSPRHLKGSPGEADDQGMSARPRLALAALGLAAVTLAPAVMPGPAPAAAANPSAGLSSTEEQARALRGELADLKARAAASVAAYEQAEDELAVAVTRSVSLSRDLDRARATAIGMDAVARDRISALYRSGGRVGLLATLAQATSPQDLVSRYANIDAVLSADTRVREDVGAAAEVVAQAETEADAVAADATRLSATLALETERLEDLLTAQSDAVADADAEVRRLVEVQRAQARAEAARALAEAAARSAVPTAFAGVVGADGAACPVAPDHSFTDTWGAPRSGGRRHQGTDVFAPEGSPAYAVVDGVIDKEGNGGLGGVTLWLRADSGDRFYYAHNSENLARVGQRVRAGEVIARVGRTGNAETTPPHVHFELHPGGGAAVNPYPWLAAICAG